MWKNSSKTSTLSTIGKIIHKMDHYSIWAGCKELLEVTEINKPSVLELGCGLGSITLEMIQQFGGNATLVDFSEEALKLAKENFEKNGIKNIKVINKNLLDISYKNKFDIVHSSGLIEHFSGKKQLDMIRVHKKAVKKSGVVIIFVPTESWYYNMIKWFVIKIKKWPFGYEEPLSKEGLTTVVEKTGMKVLKGIKSGRFVGVMARIE